MKYQFLAEHQQEYPVKTMCRVLGVAVSGYYACAPLRRIYVCCEVQPHEHRNE